ncbi:hypothetical protein L1987_12552 [Smallanthus sonchifolius]|uniref:Uncharacterized protein n=1 Tax=Smallanthus sonchifolius TaxID=185202 RepID=A0ACB9JGP9_9ASTR|nr:hypothetical protein L1987_12552 [Smallanthus sonchifolius]
MISDQRYITNLTVLNLAIQPPPLDPRPLLDQTLARAAVPSCASTGIYEALGLRDGGSDYLRKGVSKVINPLEAISSYIPFWL